MNSWHVSSSSHAYELKFSSFGALSLQQCVFYCFWISPVFLQVHLLTKMWISAALNCLHTCYATTRHRIRYDCVEYAGAVYHYGVGNLPHPNSPGGNSTVNGVPWTLSPATLVVLIQRSPRGIQGSYYYYKSHSRGNKEELAYVLFEAAPHPLLICHKHHSAYSGASFDLFLHRLDFVLQTALGCKIVWLASTEAWDAQLGQTMQVTLHPGHSFALMLVTRMAFLHPKGFSPDLLARS